MRALNILLVAATFSSCASRQTYFIDTNTVRDEVGDYTIHWDIKPGMEGKVELFVSNIPNAYPRKPFAIVPISNGVISYASHVEAPRYFMLVFDRQEAVITSPRVITSSPDSNFRDCGGYQTENGEQMKWGALYRSALLTNLSKEDSLRIIKLNLQSHIVLADDQKKSTSFPHCKYDVVLHADRSVNFDDILENIYNAQLNAKEVRNLYNNIFENYAYDNVTQFRDALIFLTDPAHYPVLISDRLGKDRVAFLMMLIQNIVGLNKDNIIDDYMLSNNLLPVQHLVPDGAKCTPDTQEALTEFFRCRPNDLNNIMLKLEQRYGSISDYITKVLKVSPEDQGKIRKLLLE